MKLNAYLLLFVVSLSFCSKQNDKGIMTLKEAVAKAQKAGYNVTYKESLKVEKPDLKNITDPNLFGYCDGRLGDDTALINKILAVSNKKNDKILKDSIPDAQTAIKVAVTAWNKIYGKDHIEKEKPYHAELKDSIWYVSGSLSKGMLVGGTAEAEILKKTGKIIRIIHGK